MVDVRALPQRESSDSPQKKRGDGKHKGVCVERGGVEGESERERQRERGKYLYSLVLCPNAMLVRGVLGYQ